MGPIGLELMEREQPKVKVNHDQFAKSESNDGMNSSFCFFISKI
jgi:hypothetical protein